MLKRFAIASVALFVTTWSALAAGSISLSGANQLDTQGRYMAGCLLYTYATGTTTPQSAYQDSALTIAWPNPMPCDASGRLPFFYLADGSIKIRLTNSAGVTQLTADGILVVGASSGAGAAPSVDATTVLATGDVKAKYGTGSLTGFVRLNGRTIGSASSGATERANTDTQTLFEYLWTADSALSVSGGRGASANADWLSNKTITLPDGRGRVLAALDDMGNSAASRLTATYFGTSAIVLGAVGGGESRTMLTANLPAYTPTGTVGITDPGHTHAQTNASSGAGFSVAGGGSTQVNGSTATASATTGITAAFTGVAQGGSSTPFAIVSPTILVTYYIKL